MSSCNSVVVYFPPAQLNTLVKDTVTTLVETPVQKLDKIFFLGCLKQGNGARNTLNEIVTALAKSKKTDQHLKIATRIQTFIADTPLKEFDVKARINEVWDEQQAAYDRLTPEKLAAYNALSPEELAEHSF